MTFKIFDLWDVSEVKVEDPGLKRYINVDARLVVKSHGRERDKFTEGKVNIVERLISLISIPGHRGKKHKLMTFWASGKYHRNAKIVIEALKIVEKELKINPISVLVRAVENAAPVDQITVIEYGGARYPQSCDISPLRRISIALRNIVHGAYDKSFNKKAGIKNTLAKEIIAAYQKSSESFALSKRNDVEKQADSAR
ncbi:MAG: 30S ribosomal protein S7 [archaeon]